MLYEFAVEFRAHITIFFNIDHAIAKRIAMSFGYWNEAQSRYYHVIDAHINAMIKANYN